MVRRPCPSSQSRTASRILDPETPKPEAKAKKESAVIAALTWIVVEFDLKGTAPLLQCAFSQKALRIMKDTQAAGDAANRKKGRNRPGRDYEAEFHGAAHRSIEGWNGIPAMAIKSAMISGSGSEYRQMQAKRCIKVVADGYDSVDGSPLVRIFGEPEPHDSIRRSGPKRIATPRVRAIYRTWTAKVKIKFEKGVYVAADIVNMLMRAGEQIGIGEGRPGSRDSVGMDFGTFSIESV